MQNFFKGLRGKPVACVAYTKRYLKKAELVMTFYFVFLLLVSTSLESALLYYLQL